MSNSRGPLPHPLSQRSQNRRLPSKTVEEPGKVFHPPNDLPPFGLDYWNRVSPTMIEHSLLNDANLPRLIDLCRKVAEQEKLRLFLEANGYAFKGTNGEDKERPEARCYFKLCSEIRAIERDFYIPPAAMARVPQKTGNRAQHEEVDDFYD